MNARQTLLITVFSALVATVQAADRTTYTPDIDLAKAPDDYRKRVIAFRNVLRREPTRDAKIEKAMALAENVKSLYRRDAVAFLGEVRATKAVPLLIRLAHDPDLSDEVLHSFGEIRDARAIPTLLDFMADESDNVRGNAERAFVSITGMTIDYHYDDSEPERKADIQTLKSWWNERGKDFRPPEPSKEEEVSAGEAWDKYGREYLHDLSR